jgi:lysophospholipase L1-like esterase
LRDDKNEHQVILDGQVLPKIVTKAGTERYLLAQGLAQDEHRLEVYRRTEALFGVTGFLGLDVTDGQILDNQQIPQRRLEVVGDSISCGYGNEGKSADCHFAADTENHYLSYGAVLARTLQAELSAVAWSGRGIVKNYAGEPGDKMGQLYQRVLPEIPTSRYSASDSYDAVIVNLGTNDFSTEPDPDESTFASAYVTLLEQIRLNHPKAFILCTVGPMLGGQDLARAEASISNAIQQRRASGDQRVIAHRMKTKNENPGCDWHPSIATHQRMAEELAVPLKEALGW